MKRKIKNAILSLSAMLSMLYIFFIGGFGENLGTREYICLGVSGVYLLIFLWANIDIKEI